MENFIQEFIKNLFSLNTLKILAPFVGISITIIIIRTIFNRIEKKVDGAISEKRVKQSICPRCGGKLIRKHGKYGDFIGCNNYPKCRFTHDINDAQQG